MTRGSAHLSVIAGVAAGIAAVWPSIWGARLVFAQADELVEAAGQGPVALMASAIGGLVIMLGYVFKKFLELVRKIFDGDLVPRSVADELRNIRSDVDEIKRDLKAMSSR